MKYTIEGFQQEILIQYNLDSVDAIILRYIIDFFNTGAMNHKIIDNQIYFWLNFGSVIEALPILNIKETRGISRRFIKYEKCGLIKKCTVKGTDIFLNRGKQIERKGTFTYFTIDGDALKALIADDPKNPYETSVRYASKGSPSKGSPFKGLPGRPQKANGVGLKRLTKDSSITYDSIKNNSISDIIKNLIDNGKGRINSVFEDDPESYINFDGSLFEIKYHYAEIGFKQKINQLLDHYGLWEKVKVQYL